MVLWAIFRGGLAIKREVAALYRKTNAMGDIASDIERRGVKATSNRILVFKALQGAAHPLSLAELEEIIATMDKSSVFRALNVFLENDIVHGIEDGSGSLKYELCHGEDHCSPADQHVHFYCEKCHTTYCFEEVPIPMVATPEGFHVHSVNYMLKGVCANCRKP